MGKVSEIVLKRGYKLGFRVIRTCKDLSLHAERYGDSESSPIPLLRESSFWKLPTARERAPSPLSMAGLSPLTSTQLRRQDLPSLISFRSHFHKIDLRFLG